MAGGKWQARMKAGAHLPSFLPIYVGDEPQIHFRQTIFLSKPAPSRIHPIQPSLKHRPYHMTHSIEFASSKLEIRKRWGNYLVKNDLTLSRPQTHSGNTPWLISTPAYTGSA